MEDKNNLMRFIIWKVLPAILKHYIGKVYGLQNLPKKGAYIVAINHSSTIDPAIVVYVLWKYRGQKLRFLGKKQHFDSWIGNKFQTEAGTIPIDRTTFKNTLTKQGFEIALHELARGEIIGIFPEGSRSKDGFVHKGRTGVARLALWAKSPVVPVTLIGAFRVWRKGRLLPNLPIGKKGKVDVVIGKPLYFNKYYKKANTSHNKTEGSKSAPKIWREMTDYIMKQIARQGKIKYVDEESVIEE